MGVKLAQLGGGHPCSPANFLFLTKTVCHVFYGNVGKVGLLGGNSGMRVTVQSGTVCSI